jgi:2-dehydro-3-deoxygluconokinase
VAFDPNIRPTLWDDAATLRAALTQAAGAASLVLPSFDDEQAAFGDATPEGSVARYLAAGAGLIVVKNGASPVVTGDRTGILAHPTPALDGPMVDSTAAGDSFNAAFLAQWLRAPDVTAAVRAGQALSAQVIAGHGALVQVSP